MKSILKPIPIILWLAFYSHFFNSRKFWTPSVEEFPGILDFRVRI